MPADEFAVLCADIKANGVREAITLYEGMVIDGWHRYSASQAEGVHCPSKLLGDGVDPVAFVISANLHRRHLTASQRALAVVTCSKWAPVGKAAKPAPGAGLQATNEQMAAAADVGERTIRQAKVVAAEGSEEVKEAVRSGAMSAKAGAEATRPAKPTQKPHAETTVATPRPQPEPPSQVKTTKLPAVAEAVPDDEEGAPSADELADAERAAVDDAERVRLILESDDAIAALSGKVTQQAAQIRILESRVRGLIGEKDEAVKLAKSWRAKFDKLERAQRAAA